MPSPGALMALSHQKPLRYAVCLKTLTKSMMTRNLVTTFLTSKISICFVKMNGLPTSRQGYPEERHRPTNRRCRKKLYRLNRKKLTKDPISVPCRMCGESIHLLTIQLSSRPGRRSFCTRSKTRSSRLRTRQIGSV